MKICQLPIYQKAINIEEITEALVSSFDKNDKGQDKKICLEMISKSKDITQKIYAAEGGDKYSLRIKYALQIKCAAKELQSMLMMCAMLNLTHKDYIQFLTEEIDAFRGLFLEWVSSFDKTNDVYDEWYFEV